MKDWEVRGADFINANVDTLNSLNINNPLIQRRILDERNKVLQSPQIVNIVMNECSEDNEIQNELDSLKKQISDISTVESGLLSLAATWKNYEGEYKKAKWFKIGKIVIVQGLVRSADFSTHMATLPEQCRPKQRIIFSLDQHSQPFRVDIRENGQIVHVKGTNVYSWISLAGIVFVVE